MFKMYCGGILRGAIRYETQRRIGKVRFVYHLEQRRRGTGVRDFKRKVGDKQMLVGEPRNTGTQRRI